LFDWHSYKVNEGQGSLGIIGKALQKKMKQEAQYLLCYPQADNMAGHPNLFSDFPMTAKKCNFKFMQTAEGFQIDIDGFIMTVTSHLINGNELFHITFCDGRPPLVVNEAISGGRIFGHQSPRAVKKKLNFSERKLQRN
jgi:hypothetical protein